MSKLHDYLVELEEQQEELINDLALIQLGWAPAGEIGSDAAAVEADLQDAIQDIQEKIDHLMNRT